VFVSGSDLRRALLVLSFGGGLCVGFVVSG